MSDGNVRHRVVDHAGIGVQQRGRVFAAVAHLLDQLRVAQIGQVDLVHLQIAAAGVGEGAHAFAVGLAEIAVELVHVRIDRGRHRLAAVAEMHRRRRRNGHLRRLAGVVFDELEMLDHRMAREFAELARDADQQLLRLHAALERDLALADHGLDAGQRRDEVGLPGFAAVLAVGDRVQADALLLLDQRLDLAVLDRLELFRRDFVFLTPRARLLQRGGAEQAADLVGAEWRLGALH